MGFEIFEAILTVLHGGDFTFIFSIVGCFRQFCSTLAFGRNHPLYGVLLVAIRLIFISFALDAPNICFCTVHPVKLLVKAQRQQRMTHSVGTWS